MLDNVSYDDFSQFNNFFSQLFALARKTSFPNMRNINSENSDYSDVVIHSKNAYLSNTVVN